MPRTSRSFGPNGFLHIITRGVNKQNIFLDDQDYNVYIRMLNNLSREMSFQITAYCLMSNHVHLLLHDKEQRFNKIMKALSGNYAIYFNRKYDRTGHLFQNRYNCKAIGTEKQLLVTVAYIHNNPESAHICPTSKYHWSSYNEYMNKNRICSTDFVMSLAGTTQNLIAIHKELSKHTDKVLELETFEYGKKIPDSDLIQLIQNILGTKDPTHIQALPIAERNTIIQKLKNHKISHRQLARLTGLSLSLIDHI